MATTLFDFNSVAALSPRFYLDEQVTLVATGLTASDYIEFEVLTLVTTETGAVASTGACHPGSIANVNVSVTGSAFLTCANGANRIRLSAIKPSIVIDSPQHSWLRAVYYGSNFGAFNVTSQESSVSCVSEALRGCEAQYCPSIALPDGGFGFHVADPKDPAATVEIAPCSPSTEDSIWLYPTAQSGATIAAYDCDGVLIGYGRNRTTCNVEYSTASSVSFSNSSGSSSGASIVSASVSSLGVLTLVLSDGSSIVSNEPAAPSCV